MILDKIKRKIIIILGVIYCHVKFKNINTNHYLEISRSAYTTACVLEKIENKKELIKNFLLTINETHDN
jgi:hypothetical protein